MRAVNRIADGRAIVARAVASARRGARRDARRALETPALEISRRARANARDAADAKTD
jgi:hypothetical protein